MGGSSSSTTACINPINCVSEPQFPHLLNRNKKYAPGVCVAVRIKPGPEWSAEQRDTVVEKGGPHHSTLFSINFDDELFATLGVSWV